MSVTLLPRQARSDRVAYHRLRPLDILTKAGILKNRAEKALVATGYCDVQLACDWLMAHCCDPSIDIDNQRDFTIVLCPVGPLNMQLNNFLKESLNIYRWNDALNALPHITLCPFFKYAVENYSSLLTDLENIIKKELPEHALPSSFMLEKHVTQGCISLCFNNEVTGILKKLTHCFIDTISPGTSSLELDYHMHLANNYLPDKQSVLESFLQCVDLERVCAWELRLFSKDTRVKNNIVYKVLSSYASKEDNELELMKGDFVYVLVDSSRQCPEGFMKGTSWLTGVTGLFPSNCVERTAESNIWTLHRAITVNGNSFLQASLHESIHEKCPLYFSLYNLMESNAIHQHAVISSVDRLHSLQIPTYIPERGSVLGVKVHKFWKQLPVYTFPIKERRKIFVVKHGERIDFTLGDWTKFSFDEMGNYHRANLNMPEKVPERQGVPGTFYKDGSLTQVGLLQALLVGEGMKSKYVKVHHVFCSPALRCIQTCTNILKGLGLSSVMPINIEPGLFEWLAWFWDGLPTWMTIEELKKAGFNINVDYEPVMKKEEVTYVHESCEDFYRRNGYVVDKLLERTRSVGGTILVVGHGASLDTCTRQLVGRHPRPAHEMTNLINKVSYCSVACAVENENGKWQLEDPGFPSSANSNNMYFDWKVLL